MEQSFGGTKIRTKVGENNPINNIKAALWAALLMDN